MLTWNSHRIVNQLYLNKIIKIKIIQFFHLSGLYLERVYEVLSPQQRGGSLSVTSPGVWGGFSEPDWQQPCTQSPLKESIFSPNALSVLPMGIFKFWITIVSLRLLSCLNAAGNMVIPPPFTDFLPHAFSAPQSSIGPALNHRLLWVPPERNWAKES